MSSREWGNSGASPLSVAIEAGIACTTGVITRGYLDPKIGVWLYDVRPENDSTGDITGCEMLQMGSADSPKFGESRALVGILGSGQAVILGLLPAPDSTANPLI